VAHKLDSIDNARVQWKDALNTDAEAGLANRDGLRTPSAFVQLPPLKRLNAFLVAFLDPHVNANGVPGLERRNIIA
jgi:hypothetical protein